jgi:plastocyanin
MRTRHFWLPTLALGILACGGSDGSGPSDNGSGGGDVTVSNNSFTPSTLTVLVGRTVTWSWNSDGVLHNVTFDDGVGNSSSQGSGTHSRAFSAAGSFPYHCTIHGSAMAGVVTVTASSSGGSGGGGGGGGDGGGTGYVR